MQENKNQSEVSKKPDIWKEQIIYSTEKPKCDHFFVPIHGSTAECIHCHTGLVGVYELKDGKPVL